jgi:hypothetical protein
MTGGGVLSLLKGKGWNGKKGMTGEQRLIASGHVVGGPTGSSLSTVAQASGYGNISKAPTNLNVGPNKIGFPVHKGISYGQNASKLETTLPVITNPRIAMMPPGMKYNPSRVVGSKG